MKKQSKKPQTKVEDPYKNFMKDLQVTTEKKNVSKQTMESFIQGMGFKTITGCNQQSCKVVKKQYAKQLFQQLINRCMMLVPSQKQFLIGFMNDFSKAIQSDFQRRVFAQLDPGKRHITLIKLFFYKKPKMCLMSHRVLVLDYSLSPHTYKLCNQNQKSSSIGIKVGSFGFSSSSSSKQSTQKLVNVQRGLTHQDLNNLMLLATVDNKNLLKMLQQFHQDKIQDVDY